MEHLSIKVIDSGNSSLGRYCVASNHIAIGDIVVTEDTFALATRANTCLYCCALVKKNTTGEHCSAECEVNMYNV